MALRREISHSSVRGTLVRNHPTPARAARVVLAALFLLLPTAAGAAQVAQDAGAAQDAQDLKAEVEMLARDVDGLRQQLWTGPRINGYYAFEYFINNQGNNPATFRQHALSLFITHSWDAWRVFTELEYEDGPALEADSSGNVQGKGAVTMEVGWFEYRAGDALVIRGGKFLLPEYWNVNHYPPVVLSTNRPLMVRNVFPTDSVGVMAHGKVFPGGVGGSYDLYYANGQSSTATDDNENKAVGGHVTIHLGALAAPFSRLDVGGSFHSERAAGLGGAYDAVGAELQANTNRLEVLAEYANRRADLSAEGFYVQPSARVYGQVRAFYRYDYLDDGTNPQTRHTLGVNWRPTANVSLKIEGNTNDYAKPGQESYDELATSVALFF